MSSPTPDDRARQVRRVDPQRRDRIIDACLDVIAAHAVAGTSHRKVAAAADVPLGSMTYHFDGMEGLLQAAFARFADSVADQFDRRLAAAADRAEAELAVATLITTDVFRTQRDVVLTHELYTLAARDPEFRRLTEQWMARSRAALERHFDPVTARVLDALIEGLTIHRALDRTSYADGEVLAGVRRVTRG
ncbi:TetR/AcrR family transcriptional regulator [Ruania zhangjianzhongii]|uniref:TetR/AcrR family transcriptional regulator n=1 Tax=Ruania zhangjianzhongii TaxID=2603206 RepID=UPI001F4545D2|nr:TetR family transcriptional regulator [Ruania zhangjianzhongii]